MTILEQVPDSLKVTASVSPTVIHFFGVPVEQWMFILSGVVSLLFIIEKIPKVISIVKGLFKK